jgi:hypothetical protein
MGRRLLVAFIISFILIADQVFTSQFPGSNTKKRFSDFLENEEIKENPITVHKNDLTRSSCFKKRKGRFTGSFIEEDVDDFEEEIVEHHDSLHNSESTSRSCFENRKGRSTFTYIEDEDEYHVSVHNNDLASSSCFEKKRDGSASYSLKDENDFSFEDFDSKRTRLSYYRQTVSRFYVNSSHSYRVTMDRSKVFQSIYKMVKDNENSWYRGLIRPFVVFEGETGFDQGGLTYEAIEILIENFIKSDDQRILNEEFYEKSAPTSSFSLTRSDDDRILDFSEAFFIETSNGIHVPNTKYPTNLFKFIGSIFALAFNFNIPLGIEFLPAFYRSLTDDQTRKFVTEQEELKYVDKQFYNGLVGLRKMDLKPLELEFMGSEVTTENLENYINHEAHFYCYLKYKNHLKSLNEGFFSLIDGNSFKNNLNLKSDDLFEIMRGDIVLTADDFVKHVHVSKLTDFNSRKWIFQIIKEFSDQERMLLFKFITARRAVPFKGLKNLMTPISFVSVYLPIPNPLHLPTASTCGSLMKIPVYPSKEILKEKLLLAINGCETFDLE